jgi:RNA recognition motif-containing protein
LTAFTSIAHIAGATNRTALFTAPHAMKARKKNLLQVLLLHTYSGLFQLQHFKMENTRVFVSGLPPTCSNDQLRNHFSTRFQVTDAHVLPKRRMGFVGFKSNETAQEAVKYFNRTFLKMSKITVDIARPVCECLRCSLHLSYHPFFAFFAFVHADQFSWS